MNEHNVDLPVAADETIDGVEMMRVAIDNHGKFRKAPEQNLHLLDYRQYRSYVSMSKRRRKIFLATLTHYDPITGKIGTTRFGQKNHWRFIPPTHIYAEKTGKTLDNFMNQWMEMLNYE